MIPGALDAFLRTPLDELLHGAPDPYEPPIALARRVAETVPAYGRLLRERGIDSERLVDAEGFRWLPVIDKASYVARASLRDLCPGGTLSGRDMLAVSSGSSGEPTFWPRGPEHEVASAMRFEQVFRDAFCAHEQTTLAMVCFPLGTWVGGMFTARCCRLLAMKGYPITVVTPGNNKAEIHRIWSQLVPSFEQVVLLGYPPFIKDVIDDGREAGIDWGATRLRMVFAGEVFSEEMRTLLTERAGLRQPCIDTASLYGTADAGVLANETPISIVMRRQLAARPEIAREIFGNERLPTLGQYDPRQRFFEEQDGSLVFSGESGIPLLRYAIGDDGGVVPYGVMLGHLRDAGFDPVRELAATGAPAPRELPFVYVFGRGLFAVSFYGANVYPENVAAALEDGKVRSWVTGKFVMQVVRDEDESNHLAIAVELARSVAPSDALVGTLAEVLRETMCAKNSEFASYVAAERRTPRVSVWPTGHPEWFPAGVKHRYTRH